MSTIEYRVENKYLVSDLDLAVIASRLHTVMQEDIHQEGDCYEVRSIYFDDEWDNCLDEKDAGVDDRKKYRIRIYNPETSPIKLEIKEKRNGLTKKITCELTKDEYDMILDGRDELTFGDKKPLNQFLLRMRCTNLRPKIVITYERTAFVHPVGNVRITFDKNIMASTKYDSFFDERIAGQVPLFPKGMHVLEVKYDDLLPSIIAKQLEIGKLQATTCSKYYMGRLAVNGHFITP